ncbi:hypothetical protein CUJ83_12555 [Methanocella sp. CWC-04]|uniref:Lipoprotein n=1 Tax=Methanooceanicella nereidis TaxID=2052831 RepID=A0AAP2W890_9EURY|nr:hypothetical protein [Methanocella sp. CWC-04]
MKKSVNFLIILLLTGSFMLSSCALSVNMQIIQEERYQGIIEPAPVYAVETLDNSKIIFLEHNLLANGTVVKGDAYFRTVDFPNYWFNENTRQLNGNIDFPINDSLTLVFGDILTLTGNFGAGTGNKLYGIYSLPVKANEATVYSVDLFGRITLSINNRMIILAPGQSYSYTRNETLKDRNATIDISYTHTYINKGILDKNNIRTSMVAI